MFADLLQRLEHHLESFRSEWGNSREPFRAGVQFGRQAVVKRVFDATAAFCGLVVLAPLFAVVGAMIKWEDGGPVFYGQERIGLGGAPFRIWKFRSMTIDADRQGLAVTHARDKRITRVGRLLRRSKIDELPQLWNVLRGEMSLVGPRPEVPRYVATYSAAQRTILSLKPGITDHATLAFRNEEELLKDADDVDEFYRRFCIPRKIALNIEYASRATFFSDLGLIFRTVVPRLAVRAVLYALGFGFAYGGSAWVCRDLRPAIDDVRMFVIGMLWVMLLKLVLFGGARWFLGSEDGSRLPGARRVPLLLGIAAVIQGFTSVSFGAGWTQSWSFITIDFIFSLGAVYGLRMAPSLITRTRSERTHHLREPARRIAIVGAGTTGAWLAAEFYQRSHLGRRVAAFFDDDPGAWTRRVHQVPVVGMPECLLQAKWRTTIDEVIIASPEISPARQAEIRAFLEAAQVEVRLFDLLNPPLGPASGQGA